MSKSYISIEHEFNVNEQVSWFGSPATVLGVRAEKYFPESYSSCIIKYLIRDSLTMKVRTVHECELSPIPVKKEELNTNDELTSI